MSWSQWCATPWDEQKALLEGLEGDESVPLHFEGGGGGMPEGIEGPVIRQVDTGDSVINLTDMRQQLEAERAKRQGR
jgi:hypothetical protein